MFYTIAFYVTLAATLFLGLANQRLNLALLEQHEKLETVSVIANNCDTQVTTCISYQARVQLELEQLNRRCR